MTRRPRPDRPERVPVSVLATTDPVLRELAILDLLVDAPRTVVLRHDLHVDDGELHRVVLDGTAVLADERIPLAHACLSCSVREDAIPTIDRLTRDGRWDAVVLALPVTAESLPAARALAWATRPAGGELRRARLASVACVAEAARLEHDLLDDDTLEERSLALHADDDRSLGEAIAAQLEHADLVVLAEPVGEDATRAEVRGSQLVDHLRGPGTARIDGLTHLTSSTLASLRHDARAAEHRSDPLHAHVRPGQGDVWSLELASDRPFHPERLVEQIEQLGAGRIRGRGVFWVPNRPDTVCVWDGAGGQLHVGTNGRWGRRARRTRLVLTGVGDERPALAQAFDDVLATPAEAADGGLAWLGRDDVLAPWLGDRADA
ncbi:cobalamin biosynthesis protein CobW [Luteimicrobium album]|uniref:Cobalamin biosynthesis protein CobW n=1 Tax=Luteimicrobium album TaxID=1054550 RepID=A0ABQ6I1V8_9MICO|nr:GTP-binding protein [Luteimicrobium album]GMA24153.1 cobalamin biosynthesis protein CobW [Luteimicrobium album]